MVTITQSRTERSRLVIELDGPQVLAAEIVQVSDVVIGLCNQQRKPVLQAMLAGQTVGFFRAVEIVQAVIANGQVPEHGSDVQRLAILQELLIGGLIDLDSLLETVLAEINIGDVAVQPDRKS